MAQPAVAPGDRDVDFAEAGAPAAYDQAGPASVRAGPGLMRQGRELLTVSTSQTRTTPSSPSSAAEASTTGWPGTTGAIAMRQDRTAMAAQRPNSAGVRARIEHFDLALVALHLL